MNALNRWKNAISPSTWQMYKSAWNRFMKFLAATEYANHTPDQLAELSIIEATDLANAFHRHMINEGYAPKTAINHYNAVRSFYVWNHKRLGKTPTSYSDYAMYETGRLVNPEEVWQMINAVAGKYVYRNRAIIAFWYQSMQRIGIICALKLKHIPQEALDNPPAVIEVPSYMPNKKGQNVNKRRVKYAFGIGKDACHYLKAYLKHRKEWGEQLDGESWLFRTYERQARNERGEPLDPSTFNDTILHKVAEAIGIQHTTETQKGKSRRTIHSHVNRRSTKALYRKAGITDPLLLDFMQGHKLPFNGAYDKFLLTVSEAVRQAEPEISFIPKTDMQYDATVARLQAELKSLPPEVQKRIFIE